MYVQQGCDMAMFITDLEWKIIYVGSAESENFDQTLDTVYVGPVPEGKHMFVFQVCYKMNLVTVLIDYLVDLMLDAPPAAL